jgi:hypothetical protein
VIQASTEIDLEDAAVARMQSKDTKPTESDRELVARLVDQARAEGGSPSSRADGQGALRGLAQSGRAVLQGGAFIRGHGWVAHLLYAPGAEHADQ